MSGDVTHALTRGLTRPLTHGVTEWRWGGLPSDMHPEAVFYANYRTNIAVVNGVVVPLDALHAVTRANADSTAERADGSVAHFGPDTLRRTDLGLLIEEERTNLITRSQEFDNVAWAKGHTGSTPPVIVANDAIAPDGTQTADHVTITRSDSEQQAFVIQPKTVSSAQYAAALYLKAKRAEDIGRNVAIWQYQASAQAVQIASLTAGWQKVPVPVPAAFGGTNAELCSFGYLRESQGGGTQTGEVQFHAWASQGEEGAFHTSYIATGASVATRNIDNVQISDLSWLTAEGTFLKVTNDINAAVPASSYLLGGSGTVAVLRREDDTTVGTFNGTTPLSILVGSGNFSGPMRSVVAFDGSGRLVVAHGGAVASDANSIGTLTALYQMSRAGIGDVSSGWDQQLQFVPRRMGASEAQDWSAPL